MTDTEQKLREIVEGLDGVPDGPWDVYDGCSWRRIGTAGLGYDDCAVLYPVKASDGHPDLSSRSGDRDRILAHIARCDPDTLRQIAAAFEALKRERGEAQNTAFKLSDSVVTFNNEAARLKAENERLRALVRDASTIISRLEGDYAIEHDMYDGRSIENWCNRVRTALEDKP